MKYIIGSHGTYVGPGIVHNFKSRIMPWDWTNNLKSAKQFNLIVCKLMIHDMINIFGFKKDDLPIQIVE